MPLCICCGSACRSDSIPGHVLPIIPDLATALADIADAGDLVYAKDRAMQGLAIVAAANGDAEAAFRDDTRRSATSIDT